MAFTSTPDSKSASSNIIKLSAPPLSIIILTVISLLIAILLMALSVVNSTWLNSTAAALVLLYHIVFLLVIFTYRKRFSSADSPIVGQHEGTEDESFDYFDRAPFKPPSIAFTGWSIAALFFLLAANLIVFSIMINVTTLSILPIKIEIAQTTALGCQLFTIGVLLCISAWGRMYQVGGGE